MSIFNPKSKEDLITKLRLEFPVHTLFPKGATASQIKPHVLRLTNLDNGEIYDLTVHKPRKSRLSKDVEKLREATPPPQTVQLPKRKRRAA